MTLSNRSANHFDANARQWDARPMSVQLAAVPSVLLERVNFQKTDRVLDFGAGTGLLALPIAAQVQEVFALDMSTKMLEVLQEKAKMQHLHHVQTLNQDIHAGLPCVFDKIVSCMALHHVQNIQALFAAFAQALYVGGEIALVDLYAEDGSFHGDNVGKGVHHLGFEPDNLKQIAHNVGFSNVSFDTIMNIQKSERVYPLFLMRATKC